MSDVRDDPGRVSRPAFDERGRRTDVVAMGNVTADDLRRFRFVTVNQPRSLVYAYTTDPEVVRGYDATFYKRSKNVTEYEVVFGPQAVEAALEVMEERK